MKTDVGPLHEGPCFGPTAGAFHVDAAEPLAPVPDALVLDAVVDANGCRALDAHDRRPMVSEEHAGHRRSHPGTQLADSHRQLHDAQIREHCGLVLHVAFFPRRARLVTKARSRREDDRERTRAAGDADAAFRPGIRRKGELGNTSEQLLEGDAQLESREV